MCIIAVESELYRIFALLLCQLLPKSVFFSQKWLWLGAQRVAEIGPVVWSGRSGTGTGPHVVGRYGGLDLEDPSYHHSKR